MKKIQKISMLILMAILVTVIAIVSCKKEPKNDSSTPTPIGNMQDVKLLGKVLDEKGEPIKGVRISTGTASATTNVAGEFSLNRTEVINKRAIIKFEKSGYFTLTRSGVQKNEMYIEVILKEKGKSDITLQETFNAAEAKDLILPASGMKIKLSAGALKRADGSKYSGAVTADVLYLEPGNPNFATMIPGGDLLATTKKEEEVMLISYGMVDVVFTDNQGKPLQLQQDAELSFPVPAGMKSNPPAEMPFWSFDEAKGIWKEEGMAKLKGGVYVGTVTHFSWVNCDIGKPTKKVRGLVVDCENKPVENVKVYSGQTYVTTNSKGEYEGEVVANEPVTFTVTAYGVTDTYSNPSGFPPGDTPQSIPNLKVACPATIKGKVVDCNNNPVITGVKIGGTNGTTYMTNSNGDFVAKIAPGLTPTTVSVTTYQGEVITRSVPQLYPGKTHTVSTISVPCPPPPPGTYTKAEEGSVRFRMYDREDPWVITFDNNGYRFRWDIFNDDGSNQQTQIINHFTKVFWVGSAEDGDGYWDTAIDYEFYSQYMAGLTALKQILIWDEEEHAAIQTGTMVVAGKTCKKYQVGASGYGTYTVASWKGLVLYWGIPGGQTLIVADAATDVVPEVAFTQTFNISWLPPMKKKK